MKQNFDNKVKSGLRGLIGQYAVIVTVVTVSISVLSFGKSHERNLMRQVAVDVETRQTIYGAAHIPLRLALPTVDANEKDAPETFTPRRRMPALVRPYRPAGTVAGVPFTRPEDPRA